MELTQAIDRLKELKTEREILKKRIKGWKKEKEEKLILLDNLKTTRDIFQKASKLTQQQLSVQVSDIVSKALAIVFEDPYEFGIEFVERRNTTECDLFFEKNGNRYSPLSDCGYGAADVASLALRVAFWKLEKDARNVLILDEPTRNLSLDKQPLASLMIKKLSQMGLQFLIVTHQEALTKSADKVFEVDQIDDVSTVKELIMEAIPYVKN